MIPTLTRETVTERIRNHFGDAETFSLIVTLDNEDDAYVWSGRVVRLDGSVAEWSFEDHYPDALNVVEVAS